MNLNNLLIVICFSSPLLIFLIYLYWTNRCPKGGQHDYYLIDSKFIKGNDIGFGITNSYYRETYKCTKCNDEFESIK